MSEPNRIVVPLSRPIHVGDDKMLSRVVLREPKMREYMKFGEPVVFMPDVNGHDVPVEMDEVIERYFERLVVEPDIPALLGNLHLVDAIKVKEALLSFFLDSREEALRRPAASSSSASDGFVPPNGTI